MFRYIIFLWFLTGCTTNGFEQKPPSENLLGEAIGTDRVLISWDYPQEEATLFKLDIFGPGDEINGEESISGSDRNFVVANLVSETTYSFQLAACNQDDCSEPSELLELTTQSSPPARSKTDRPDEITGPQVHVIYAVPYDKLDRQLDANGTLTTSIQSFHNWFRQKSNLQIRFDRFNGEVDITFYRFGLTDQELRPWSLDLVLNLEKELKAANLIKEDKIYLIYYDGSSSEACGGASWPPHIQGQSAALYLRGEPSTTSCGSRSFVNSATDFPRYWEFAALHDLLHVFGIVSRNAPNHMDEYPAHVDEPVDLMHSGPRPWVLGEMTGIDVLGNNYFGPDVPDGVVRLTDSRFIEEIPEHVAVYPFKLLSSEDEATLKQAFRDLPMHAPFLLYEPLNF